MAWAVATAVVRCARLLLPARFLNGRVHGDRRGFVAVSVRFLLFSVGPGLLGNRVTACFDYRLASSIVLNPNQFLEDRVLSRVPFCVDVYLTDSWPKEVSRSQILILWRGFCPIGWWRNNGTPDLTNDEALTTEVLAQEFCAGNGEDRMES
ncbi:hypothetical protein NL676_006020 [Syzygium grande]|nr:hypothetical protein NL676_006020 [Syzygium grande]